MSTSFSFQSPQWRDDNDGFLDANDSFFFDARPVLDSEETDLDMNTAKVFQFNEVVSVVDVTGKVTEAPLARGDGFWNTLQYEHEIGAMYGASDMEFDRSLSFQEMAQDYGSTTAYTETGSESLSLVDLRSSTNSIEETNNSAQELLEADSGSMSIGNVFGQDGGGGGFIREVGSLFNRAAHRFQANDNNDTNLDERVITDGDDYDDDDDDNSFHGNDSSLNDSRRFNSAQNTPIFPNGLTAQ
jgi:hypothetical protein